MNTAEIVTVVMGIFTFLMGCMVGLLTYIWHDNRRSIQLQMNELREQMRTNGRHLDSLMHSSWVLTWRINATEDYLGATEGSNFRPPRIIGDMELRPREQGE